MFPRQLPQVFISYRKETVIIDGNKQRQTPTRVKYLAEALRQSGQFEVFIDEQRLQAADDWAKRIITELSRSRVLIVMLRSSEDKELDTGWSDWVQREVDVARGERIVTLPIKLEEAAPEHLQATLENLGLSHVQYMNYPDGDEALQRLLNRLRECVEETNKQQRRRIQELESRFLRELDVEPYASQIVYTPFGGSCRVHIGCGDMARARNIDVLVNSENNYMQMARFHEPKHLSSRLRFAGAMVPDGSIDQYHDDTLQDELSAQVKRLHPIKPVPVGAIIPTHAGHPQSQLAHQRIRYVFHAASVSFTMNDEGSMSILPISIDRMYHLTEQCLKATRRINEKAGVPIPDHMPELQPWAALEGDAYQPIRSIMLPVFGTGGGNRGIVEVCERIATGILRYLKDDKDERISTLTDIHLCLYSDVDLPPVKEALEGRFQ